ncbi:LPXTG cell wall anchor domain-containing protein [Dactylosporangium aurantiacum]|uniref:LPXTG cell wall anchor domain-containing protein n=1 Tax=Dactylosporangium aurantiacum TaxID=35754 RepID=A0A9Q9IG05_9ACTN|nr:neocarzinostatin apoprotein domain-containing protein [Dactylosporangium aurantiacum]MDG6103626.1 neocarzinostatin apoprotein domain-containing protein [Dactylosporangium aurantiacum]UWZ51885.1 LPXTG cell wall anchor domain-containing protein [Dactylosporangium aurantiacum]
MQRRIPTLTVLVTAALAGVVPLGAAPAWAAPTLTVSKTTGLTDGASVTVGGSGFTPNLKQIAVGQCIEEVKGPTDCNLAGGSQFVNADAAGKLPTVTLKLAQKFGTFDCTKRTCVIAAQILPSGGNAGDIAANKASVKLTFGAAAQATTQAAQATTAAAEATALPKTGPGDEPFVVVLAGSALLTVGVGLLVILPARRRRARTAEEM